MQARLAVVGFAFAHHTNVGVALRQNEAVPSEQRAIKPLTVCFGDVGFQRELAATRALVELARPNLEVALNAVVHFLIDDFAQLQFYVARSGREERQFRNDSLERIDCSHSELDFVGELQPNKAGCVVLKGAG